MAPTMDKEKRRRLDEMFNALSVVADGAYIYLCDMESDISRWSKSAVNFFGLPGEYMKNAGGIWSEHIHPDDRNLYEELIERIFVGSDNDIDMQYRARSANGDYVSCSAKGIVIRNENNKPIYFGGSINNHGTHKYIDSVTGLRSLYGFFEDLREIFIKEEESVIALIGLSDFSRYNDVYGYSFGNRMLHNIAVILKKKFGDSGTVYRMDGPKFAVITHGIPKDEVVEIYEDIQFDGGSRLYVEDQHVVPSFNAGAVVIDDFTINDKTVYSCLKYVYRESKKKKMGDIVVYDDALTDDNRHKLERLSELRRNITEDYKGFYLYYQPVVDTKTEKLKAAEALIRWKDDRYGVVPPDEFIKVLEQDPIFPQLGKWILRRAMIDGQKLLEKYPKIVINVNLSYTQLEKGGFIEDVLDVLDETGFPPDHLCLEVTERCRLLDINLLKNIISILKDRGIKIAIDDFGTGYSSIGVLKEIQADTIKVDREVVKDIENQKTDRDTIKFISDLGSSYAAEVCVEGVETIEMRDILRKYKIKSLQGFLYSKPVPLSDFMQLGLK